ncbi:hypothetical protein [Siphonobacter sp. SORGH_AS_1065]|uniref:hypothetical protein n=1 Tax=Siphonobacter sp. SORGH_AS_1065 TaxID=3041795 RepID=UPI002784141B|nr:hypothetical protein [Siphonobacter sp. SORGH_AS_1065]MDQ1090190.1 hypothetical protein [Siphonobacter sp. SORGH_AS_1065]
MHYSVQQIVILFVSVPILIAAITAGIRFKWASGWVKVLCCIQFFAVATQTYSYILWYRKITNLFLYPIYTIIEGGLFIWMYSLMLESAWLQKARVWLILLLAVVVGSKYLKLNSFQDFINHNLIDGLSRVVEGGIVIALVIAYFFKLFREIKTPYIHQEPAFWVSGGLLIYFSCTIILYLFANFVRRYSQEFNQSFWVLHAALNVLLYSAYSVALWKLPRK